MWISLYLPAKKFLKFNVERRGMFMICVSCQNWTLPGNGFYREKNKKTKKKSFFAKLFGARAKNIENLSSLKINLKSFIQNTLEENSWPRGGSVGVNRVGYKEKVMQWKFNFIHTLLTFLLEQPCTDFCINHHSHSNGLYWGHTCSWTLTPASSMQVSNMHPVQIYILVEAALY